jgi:hypothetical protein
LFMTSYGRVKSHEHLNSCTNWKPRKQRPWLSPNSSQEWRSNQTEVLTTNRWQAHLQFGLELVAFLWSATNSDRSWNSKILSWRSDEPDGAREVLMSPLEGSMFATHSSAMSLFLKEIQRSRSYHFLALTFRLFLTLLSSGCNCTLQFGFLELEL